MDHVRKGVLTMALVKISFGNGASRMGYVEATVKVPRLHRSEVYRFRSWPDKRRREVWTLRGRTVEETPVLGLGVLTGVPAGVFVDVKDDEIRGVD
jgi:hypothetical protein